MRLLTNILFSLLLLIPLSGVSALAQDLAKIDSLQYLIETSNDDSVKVYLNVAIAKEYFKKDVITSLEYGQKALGIAEKSENPKILSYALYNLGVSYYQQGVMELAIQHFFRYLEINKDIKDEKAIAYALVNIGAIYLEMNELEKAAKYFENGLEKFEHIYADTGKPCNETISIYNNLGVVAKQRKQSETAIDYFRRGISLARRTPGFETELANLLNNLGNIYLETGNPDESIGYLREALQIRLENDDRSGLIRSYLYMAKYHRAKEDFKDALDFLYKARHLAAKVGTITSMAEVLKSIFEIYQERQLADSALKYHILYTQIEEKLNKNEALNNLKEHEIASDYREKERIMQFEMKRDELKFKLMILTLILLTIIFGLIFILAHNRSRRLKLEKENIELNAANLELEKARLENQLEAQNKKLATTGIYDIQKNEIINNIIGQLEKYNLSETKNYRSELLTSIIKDLKNTQNTSAWHEFELRFEQVHTGFFRNLNKINPALSPNDRRLCAFLKLNMTSKEISSITGQSYRSIEVARTRLRKKLNLTNSDTSLIEFLSHL